MLYLGILLVLLLSAMTSGINLLVLLFGMLLGVLVVSMLLVRPALRGAVARRRLPSGVFAGQPFAVEVELKNKSRYLSAWSISVRDGFRTDGQQHWPAVWFPRVAGGRSRNGVYRAVLPRRGRYQLGPLRLTTSFPVGLAQATRTLPAEESLIVYPRPGKLTARWTQGWDDLDVSRSRDALRRTSVEEEFRSLREFRAGDSTRLIHWRTSARKGELMVREFEYPQTQDSVVLLDLWTPDDASPAQLQVVEDAVSFAATVCATACRNGRGRVVLGIAGREKQLIQGPASPGLVHRLLTALACATASSSTDPKGLLEEIHRYGTAEGRLVIVGTRPTDWLRPGGSGTVPRPLGWSRARTRVLDASSPEFPSYFQR